MPQERPRGKSMILARAPPPCDVAVGPAGHGSVRSPGGPRGARRPPRGPGRVSGFDPLPRAATRLISTGRLPAGRSKGTVHGRFSDRRGRRDHRVGLRLHQRFPRHGERYGHVNCDGRAAAQGRGGDRRVPQPRRCLPVRAGGEDDLRWPGRREADHSGRDLRRAGRGDHVEPDDLVHRAAVQFVARPLRRSDRRDVGGRRSRRHPLQHRAGQGRRCRPCSRRWSPP